MAKILYISLTGMTEALGESQVVQYLLELAKHNTIYLLSFEKPIDKEKYQEMKVRLANANIQWKYFEYSNRYGVLSTFFQVTCAFFMLSKWIKKENIQLIHARSLIPAVIGSLLKKAYGVKLLFDIRGFAIDEKIMDGRLKSHSMLTRFLRKIEAKVYKNADHVVTLTHVSKPIIEEKYRVKSENVTVIPTCANIDLFRAFSVDEKIALRKSMGYSQDDFVIMHSGSLNGWVDFDAELKLFEQIVKINPNAKILFLNKGQHLLIQSYLEKYNLKKDKYKIISAEFKQVSQYLNLADVCVFFIKPSFAKQASAPTKFAELMACNLYAVTNKNYGDMEYYMNSYRVGVLLDLDEVHSGSEKASNSIINMIKEYKSLNSNDFNRLFEDHFSKDIAITRYQYVYDSLTKGAL